MLFLPWLLSVENKQSVCFTVSPIMSQTSLNYQSLLTKWKILKYAFPMTPLSQCSLRWNPSALIPSNTINTPLFCKAVNGIRIAIKLIDKKSNPYTFYFDRWTSLLLHSNFFKVSGSFNNRLLLYVNTLLLSAMLSIIIVIIIIFRFGCCLLQK